MKRFLTRFALLVMAMLCIIAIMHVVAVWSLRDDLERTYTIKPSTEVLFIGSSQMGCSIDEDEADHYHLQKIWVSYTLTSSFLMRLKELERRGQLDTLKVVVVPFNVYSAVFQDKNGYLWSWYQELPVSWRYLDMLPYSKLEFAWYILCNLRFPFNIHLHESPPIRKGLASHTEAYREKLTASFCEFASAFKVEGLSPGWVDDLLGAYEEMRNICARKGIRFVVYKAPILSGVEQHFQKDFMAQISQLEDALLERGIEYIKPEINLGDQYFFDNVHLITDGAKLFTGELFRILHGMIEN